MRLQRFIRFAEDGLATVLDQRRTPSTPSQVALARRLADDLDALSQTQTTGDGSDFWQSVCFELTRIAAQGDPMNFMRWPPIRATMVHGATQVTFRQWLMLRRSPDWRTVWAPALRHPRYGHPPPFPPMLSTNAMTIEHAAHLFRFRHVQGVSLQDADCIVEFGGGFGSMCRLARALGFRGHYIIFDLPPVAALQRYYLALHGIETANIGTASSGAASVWLCHDLDAIMAWLSRARPARVSLMSTWAISEMPLAVRQKIEPFFCLDTARLALLAYQPEFGGIDNRHYFRDLMSRTENRWLWAEVPIDPSPHSPASHQSFYVFGSKR